MKKGSEEMYDDHDPFESYDERPEHMRRKHTRAAILTRDTIGRLAQYLASMGYVTTIGLEGIGLLVESDLSKVEPNYTLLSVGWGEYVVIPDDGAPYVLDAVEFDKFWSLS